MMFNRRGFTERPSDDIVRRNSRRCGQFGVVASFFILIIAIIFLFLAITAQFSEQKTAYYLIFVACILAICACIAMSIFQFRAAVSRNRKGCPNFLTSSRAGLSSTNGKSTSNINSNPAATSSSNYLQPRPSSSSAVAATTSQTNIATIDPNDIQMEYVHYQAYSNSQFVA